MINGISTDTTGLLALNNNIRISNNSVFNAEEAYQSTFEDLLLETVAESSDDDDNNGKIENNNLSDKPSSPIKNSLNLGIPSGFNLDTSLLEKIDETEQGAQNSNEYMTKNSAFQMCDIKNALNCYLLNSK